VNNVIQTYNADKKIGYISHLRGAGFTGDMENDWYTDIKPTLSDVATLWASTTSGWSCFNVTNVIKDDLNENINWAVFYLGGTSWETQASVDGQRKEIQVISADYASGSYAPYLEVIMAGSPPKTNNHKPELDTIAVEDAQVGKLFELTLTAMDEDDDLIKIVRTSKSPRGMNDPVDGITDDGKIMATFYWTPTEDQADKVFTVTFKAKEQSQGDQHGRKLFTSEPRKAKIRVFPAGISPDNAVTPVINRSKWQPKNNQLIVSGKLRFDRLLTKQERSTLLASNATLTIVDANTHFELLSNVQLTKTGTFSAAIELTPDAVSCAVEVEYLGNKSARSVKGAPKSSCP